MLITPILLSKEKIIMTYIFIFVFIVIFFSWLSYSRRGGFRKERLIYREGDYQEDDSDADMQEQYSYLNKKEKT